jgi:hypothetical protein
MITNFNINQAKFLPKNNNGVCFVACIDWCGGSLRGRTFSREYYTDKTVDTWFPYIEQQKEYSKDRAALQLTNYGYLAKLLNTVDKQIAVSEIKDNDLLKAIKNLPVGRTLLIGFTFEDNGKTYGHAVAFHNKGNGANG